MARGSKPLKLRPVQQRLVPGMGGCIASDRIAVDGEAVGAMLREPADREEDSGWLFLAGDESQDYMDEADNFALYEVNTIANHDPAIVPYLYALPGQRFDRDPATGGFEEAQDSEPNPRAARLPPGVDVVQGRLRLSRGSTFSGGWTIELPAPLRRRLEDAVLVLWRPCLTFWIAVVAASGSTDERLQALRAQASPNATDLQTRNDGRLMRFSYRLREDTTDAKVPSMYAVVVGDKGHVSLGIYGDREEDIVAARSIAESVRYS